MSTSSSPKRYSKKKPQRSRSRSRSARRKTVNEVDDGKGRLDMAASKSKHMSVKSTVHVIGPRSDEPSRYGRRDHRDERRVESYGYGSRSQMKDREAQKKFNVERSSPCPSLCIFGIGPNETETDLFRRFKDFGFIKGVNVVRYQNGQSRQFAFIDYKYTSEADRAKRKMKSALLHGYRLRIEFSKRR